MRAFSLAAALFLAACGNTTGADILRAAVWPIPVPDTLFVRPDIREGEWDPADAAAPDTEPGLTLTLGSRRGVARRGIARPAGSPARTSNRYRAYTPALSEVPRATIAT